MFAVIALLVTLLSLRDSSIGDDTHDYLRAYAAIRECGCLIGRHEAGFELLSLLSATVGLDSSGYLGLIAVTNMGLWLATTARLGEWLGTGGARFRFQAAIFSILLISPVFLQAHINAIRQGLATPAIIGVVVCINRRRWKMAAFWASCAISLHISSVLYIASLLLIWLPGVALFLVTAALLLLYTTGVTDSIIRLVSTLTGLPLYDAVANFGSHAATYYRSGVRMDFVVATFLAWLIAAVASRFIAQDLRDSITIMLRAYICLCLPFLLLGWGVYSNRYLFTPWLIMSVIGGIGLYGMMRRWSNGIFLLLMICTAFVFLLRLGYM